MHIPIAITGAGVLSPSGAAADAVWSGLVAAPDLCGHWQKRPLAFYPVNNVISIPEDVWTGAMMSEGLRDRAQILARVAVESALKDAGLPSSAVPRLGCVLGSTLAGVEALEDGIVAHERSPRMDVQALDASCLLSAPRCHWTGPASVICTACSSGLLAPAIAIDMLLAGEADAMIAGGLDVLLEYTICGFNALRAVAPDRCRPFSIGRRGIVPSEGAACFCLERLDAALARGARVKAIIDGYGIGCDADQITVPNVTGVARTITQALQMSGLSPDAFGGIFAHGTGTPLNDANEVAALRAVFADTDLPPITSIKSVMGHSQGAAGAFSLLAAVVALEKSSLPATAGCEPDPELGRVDVVNAGHRHFEKKHLIVNAFGFGGNNCVVVVSAAPSPSDMPEEQVDAA
jgi:3-oxoacyl-[acyl-carrier-protein] synthase II